MGIFFLSSFFFSFREDWTAIYSMFRVDEGAANKGGVGQTWIGSLCESTWSRCGLVVLGFSHDLSTGTSGLIYMCSRYWKLYWKLWLVSRPRGCEA